MTTITIKKGKPLPQTEFENWEEFFEVLNIFSLDFRELEKTEITAETLLKIEQSTKDGKKNLYNI